jgi:hypothetical protein
MILTENIRKYKLHLVIVKKCNLGKYHSIEKYNPHYTNWPLIILKFCSKDDLYLA